jgi:hypothetical protein
MLETIREYASEQLESAGEAGSIAQRHTDYFVDLAERAEPALRGRGDNRLWLNTLERESENLRTTLGRLIHAGDGERAQRLVQSLFFLWHDRGPAREVFEWFREALALPSAPVRRARTLALGGIIAAWAGEAATWGDRWASEGRRLARQLGDHIAIALLSGREESLAAARASRDSWTMGVTLVTVLSHETIRDPVRLQELADEAAALDDLSVSTRAMLAMCRGVVAERAGDVQAAWALYREAVELGESIGFQRTPALMLDLGYFAVRQGAFGEARTQLVASATWAGEIGDAPRTSAAVAGLALVAAGEGNALLAAALRGAIANYQDAVGDPPMTEFRDGLYDADFERFGIDVGDDELAPAYAYGRTLSIDDAFRLVLERQLRLVTPTFTRVA